MSGQTYFAPWRVLKPVVFVAFLLVWNGMFLIAILRERGSVVGTFKTPESNLLVVGTFVFLYRNFAGRVEGAAEGELARMASGDQA